VAAVREPLIVLDNSLRVVVASRAFYKMFPMETADTEGRPFHELSFGLDNIPALRLLLQDVIFGRIVIEAYEVELDVPNIGRRHMLLNARPVFDQKSPDTMLLVGLEDVTARREAQVLRELFLKQQETLLLEVQHRVANSLQIVASILLLKARNVQSEEARSHLRDVHKRVLSIATVQHQLRTSGWADVIEFGPYLSTLCEGLASSMIEDDKITVTATSTGGTVRSDDAVSLGLIVTELVINSLKHGFPDGRDGHIVVDFAGDGPAWRLTVSDNGIGRRDDQTEPPHIGLGTSIVEALARNLKAGVEVAACSPGTATSVLHAA
jgi:chemotaxis protein methyltransferase CheR